MTFNVRIVGAFLAAALLLATHPASRLESLPPGRAWMSSSKRAAAKNAPTMRTLNVMRKDLLARGS